MTSIRKFHSIAALCGDGLRPELQALFERLALDPHSELFVRKDGMVQSGPDPVSAEAPLPQTTGEARTSNAGSSQILLGVRNSSPQTETPRLLVTGCDPADQHAFWTVSAGRFSPLRPRGVPDRLVLDDNIPPVLEECNAGTNHPHHHGKIRRAR